MDAFFKQLFIWMLKDDNEWVNKNFELSGFDFHLRNITDNGEFLFALRSSSLAFEVLYCDFENNKSRRKR